MNEEKVTWTAREEEEYYSEQKAYRKKQRDFNGAIKKMKGEEIVERGLIAYCIIMFSWHTMLNIVMAERLKEKKR